MCVYVCIYIYIYIYTYIHIYMCVCFFFLPRTLFVKCSVELDATYLQLWAQAWTVTEKKLVRLDYLEGRLPDGHIK